MDTIILKTRPSRMNDKLAIRFEVIGTGRGADAMKEAIRTLEHYPSPSERRALVDVLSLIDRLNYHIRYTEHLEDEGIESWLFVLQG